MFIPRVRAHLLYLNFLLLKCMFCCWHKLLIIKRKNNIIVLNNATWSDWILWLRKNLFKSRVICVTFLHLNLAYFINSNYLIWNKIILNYINFFYIKCGCLYVSSVCNWNFKNEGQWCFLFLLQGASKVKCLQNLVKTFSDLSYIFAWCKVNPPSCDVIHFT